MRTPFAFLALLATISLARADFLIQPNDSIMIAGDSITEQKVYSVYLEDYFLMCQPTEGQVIAQSGWSGETAGGFLNRLDCDIAPFKPTVVTTCYGMNDGGYGPANPSVLTNYRNGQRAIVDWLKKHNVRVIVLGSPKCVDSDYFRSSPPKAIIYNQTLSQLADIDKDIAQKEGITYADVYGATLATMKKAKAAFGPKYNFGGGDGVHPGPNGHLVMAYAMLKALGCDGAIGTVTINLGLQQADASPGQKILSYKDGTAQIESTRYPFCFDGDPNVGDQTNANVTKFFPFNQDLNRYMLVVKGLTADKAKVTWGSNTKEFTKDQLEQGVNLAAEFMHNPFYDQFHKVDAAVQTVQSNETAIMRQYLFTLPALKQIAPSTSATLDTAAQQAVAADRDLFQKTQVQVIPVQHTITVTPE